MKKAIYVLVFLIFTFASWFAATQANELEPDGGLTFWYVMASLYAAVIAAFGIYKTFEDDL